MEDRIKLQRATYHLWTFTVSKLISTSGAQVYSFAISFYILQLTGSATSFATNLLCNILPRTLAAPFIGYVADNYSRKIIIITSQIATTLAIGGLLFISLTSGLSLIAIYTTTCILSITSTFSGVTFTSSITGLVDEHEDSESNVIEPNVCFLCFYWKSCSRRIIIWKCFNASFSYYLFNCFIYRSSP